MKKKQSRKAGQGKKNASTRRQGLARFFADPTRNVNGIIEKQFSFTHHPPWSIVHKLWSINQQLTTKLTSQTINL
jgi:hypothetical protein